jgi:hypothetical protein
LVLDDTDHRNSSPAYSILSEATTGQPEPDGEGKRVLIFMLGLVGIGVGCAAFIDWPGGFLAFIIAGLLWAAIVASLGNDEISIGRFWDGPGANQ